MGRRARAVEDLVSRKESAFWRGKRVFVTGHTGFKGSWLSAWLKLLGASVTGYSLAPERKPNLFEDAQISEGMHSIIGDVRDRVALAGAIEEASPEIVLHLAAQPLVRRSYAEPVETFASNVLGTVHLLDAVRHAPSVRVVLIVTTDKCYENHEWCWGYRETDALGGRDPYSVSKACAELVTLAYRQSFLSERVAVASARAGNVIGGGDWAEDRVVPDIVRSVIAARPAFIRNPRAVRPWQHVLDPLSGYLLLAQRLWWSPELAGAYNFGPSSPDAVSVRVLAEAIVESLGRGSLEFGESSGNAGLHEASSLRLDCAKARSLLRWAPRLDTDRAIALTARFYSECLADPRSASTLVREQITAYGRPE
jgi:CDP-glucose 4,6-dehydratase